MVGAASSTFTVQANRVVISVIGQDSTCDLSTDPCMVSGFRESAADSLFSSVEQDSCCHHSNDFVLTSTKAGLGRAVITW